jgi:hypothetical protein
MIRALPVWVLALALAACAEDGATAEPSSTEPPSPLASASVAASPSPPASLTPTAAPSMTTMVYVNEAQGWSIGLPDGWDVQAENATGAILAGEDGFLEMLLAPATGLTPERREERRLAEVSSTWPGVDEIESDVVALPAGEAVRLTFETGVAPDPPAWFIFYVFEEGDTQYVMSVRGPKDNDDLPAIALAMAESFAILD